DEIVVTPSSEVGSIGVYTVRDDINVALENLGVKRTLIGAGKFKGEDAPFNPLSDETRAYI
ncbi:MAG TPA: S49 family peptidase, partial [Devosia sp.]|nr:S49 family peptidase [Devosia sp.]